MNFWTFLACVVLIVIWHVVHLVYKYFEVFVTVSGREIAMECYESYYKKREAELQINEKQHEKRTIGFQTEVINEKEES